MDSTKMVTYMGAHLEKAEVARRIQLPPGPLLGLDTDLETDRLRSAILVEIINHPDGILRKDFVQAIWPNVPGRAIVFRNGDQELRLQWLSKREVTRLVENAKGWLIKHKLITGARALGKQQNLWFATEKAHQLKVRGYYSGPE